MKKWLRRIRGAIGIGLTWAAAWGAAGTIVMLGFLLVTGSRPDAPFPFMLAAFGFVAGVVFSGVLSLAEGRRRFDQMSLARFAAWGTAGGFMLSTIFVLGSVGDPAFLWNLVVVGPVFAVAAAGSAAGSLALARRAQDRELLEPTEDVTAVGPQIRSLLLLVALGASISAHLDAQQQTTRVTLLSALRIGDQRDSNYTLTGIRSLVMLPTGGIAVIDMGGRGSVKTYDRSGRFVRTIARPGQGPAEFGSWAALVMGAKGDLIWIVDRQRSRIMFLDTLGTLRQARSASAGVGTAGFTGLASAVLSDGTELIEPTRECAGVTDWSPTRAPLRRVDSAGKDVNTLGELRPSPCGERVADGRNGWVFNKLFPQFTDEPLWGWQPGGETITLVDRDAVADANPATFRVRRLNADGTVIFDQRYPYTPIPLTPTAKDSAKSVSLGTSVTDAARPAALAIDWHFPAHMPTISRVMVGSDGSTWLQREAQSGSRRDVWTLIDPAGTLIGDGGIPAGITPYAADVSSVWGVERDADGVPTIVRFRMIYVTRAVITP